MFPLLRVLKDHTELSSELLLRSPFDGARKLDTVDWSLLGGLRFVLATVVVFSHLLWIDNVSKYIIAIADLGSKAAVVGFLAVSGFSIAASIARKPNGFYLRRFKRIYPMYFLSIIAAVILQIWLGDLQLPNARLLHSGFITIVGNVFLLQTFFVHTINFNPVLWTLACEVSFYAVAPLLWRLPFWGFAALFIFSAAFYLLPHNKDWGLAYGFLLKANAIKYFWPFIVGFTLYSYRDAIYFLAVTIVGAALVWLSDINYEPYAVPTLIASTLAIWCAGRVRFSSKVLSYLGDVSYPLYVVQIPTIVTAYALFGIKSGIVLYAATVIVAIASYELVEFRLKPQLFDTIVRKAISAF